MDTLPLIDRIVCLSALSKDLKGEQSRGGSGNLDRGAEW